MHGWGGSEERDGSWTERDRESRSADLGRGKGAAERGERKTDGEENEEAAGARDERHHESEANVQRVRGRR